MTSRFLVATVPARNDQKPSVQKVAPVQEQVPEAVQESGNDPLQEKAQNTDQAPGFAPEGVSVRIEEQCF